MPITCFDEGVLAPPASERLTRFDAWLTRYYERAIVLPDGWKRHVLRWHGGAPLADHRCFVEPGGRIRAICRMLNIHTLDEKLVPEVAIDYSIDAMLDGSPHANRLLDGERKLVPFAALDHAGHDPRGMTEFDLLCFDVTDDGNMPIVSWSFESGRTIRVADDWDALENMIRSDVTDPCVEPASPAWE